MNDRMKLFITNNKFIDVVLQKRHRDRFGQMLNFYPHARERSEIC